MDLTMPKERYAAKLLFQFRVDIDGNSGKRRICETRILNFDASSATEAYRKAQSKGKSAEFEYDNDAGNAVFFEFVGLIELLKLTPECTSEEVWYEISHKLLPMERREQLVPPKESLNIFKDSFHDQVKQ